MVITANLWAMLGVTLVVGFVFGLFVSNAGKYKRLWRAERTERERAEKARDAEFASHEQLLRERDARIAELTLGQTDPARDRDRLSAISGIDPSDEVMLNGEGYYRYEQIARLSAEEKRVAEQRLGRERGAADAQEWSEQARMLAAGESDEHLRRYGASHRVI